MLLNCFINLNPSQVQSANSELQNRTKRNQKVPLSYSTASSSTKLSSWSYPFRVPVTGHTNTDAGQHIEQKKQKNYKKLHSFKSLKTLTHSSATSTRDNMPKMDR